MKLPNRTVLFAIFHKNIYKKTVVKRQTVIRHKNGSHVTTVPVLGFTVPVFKDPWDDRKIKYRADIFIQ